MSSGVPDPSSSAVVSAHSIVQELNPPALDVGGAIDIPDKRLLFSAEMQRLDDDLNLVGRDGKKFSIPNYFAEEERRPLICPEGAALAGNIVDLLAKRLDSGLIPPSPKARPHGPPIGAVQIIYNSTVVRNFAASPLIIGNHIFRDDIIQTDADGEVGVALADQTVFVLQKNSRIAIETFQFDENRGDNFAVYTIINGSAAFVAGKIATAGDMRIVTPVATFAIRGATGKGVLKVSLDARDPVAIPQAQIYIFPNSDGPPGHVDIFSLEGTLVGSLTTNGSESARAS